MSRSFDDIDLRFLPRAFELYARISQEIGPTLVVDTLRTPEEQQIALATGHSATTNSKHLPQPPSGKALAIDLAPWEIWQAHGPDKIAWPVSDVRWVLMGRVGKKLGLRWGGDWRWPNDANFWEYRDPRTVRPFDPGHFEMVILN